MVGFKMGITEWQNALFPNDSRTKRSSSFVEKAE
jgi:hypothetical protein